MNNDSLNHLVICVSIFLKYLVKQFDEQNISRDIFCESADVKVRFLKDNLHLVKLPLLVKSISRVLKRSEDIIGM